MKQIVRGVRQFQNKVYAAQKDFFEMLAAKQQTPQALFITCSDSRVDPNLLTQTEPGTLFLLRSVGNIIPPYGSAHGGEGATIEYALSVLGVPHIIICGHSHCGAMKALLRPEAVHDLPEVSRWFRFAEATRRVARERCGHLCGAELDRAVIEENVLVQLNNLSTHPHVAARLAAGTVQLFGWYYEIETGQVYEYRQEAKAFLPLGDLSYSAVPLCIRSPGDGAAVPVTVSA